MSLTTTYSRVTSVADGATTVVVARGFAVERR
jgi:hypothetical protein